MTSGWFLNAVLILLFVLVGGYFSATEMALVSLRDGQVRRLRLVALFAAPGLDRGGRLFRPLTRVLTATADAVTRMLGLDPHARAAGVSEAELRDLVGSPADLTRGERRVLADVFTATDRLVAEVMIPRTEIDFLDGAMRTEEATVSTSRRRRPPSWPARRPRSPTPFR